MATVSLDGVTKIYKGKTGEVCAVDRICLDVSDREFVVLVGPSGCGKTTTLRLVAGLEAANAGTIRIGERVVNNVAPKDRDIAMVFQNYALYPHMTVFKNMAFGLKMRRVPKGEIKRKVHEVARMLGIEQLLDRKPAALSGGERQRVAVGRAIVRRPQVFLFDEPLSNLDAKLRTHMRTEIKGLHRQLEATILYVTHDQEEAMTLGDRLVVMDGGVVQQCGTPLEVYNRPVNRFVAGFIGRPSMNFLEGRLEADSVAANGVCFIGSGGFRLDLAPDRARKLQPHVGQNVILGVRPEHAQLLASDDETEPESGAVIEFTISVVEPLGDRLHVHGVTPADEPLVVQAAATAGVEPGERRRLLIDPSHPHLFSPDATGKRLDASPERPSPNASLLPDAQHGAVQVLE